MTDAPTPRVVDNDRDTISVMLGDEVLHGWRYGGPTTRSMHFRDATAFVAGWNAASKRVAPRSEIQIEKMRMAVERAAPPAVVEAARAVLALRVGDLPSRGWLPDSERSRKALADLHAALATAGAVP